MKTNNAFNPIQPEINRNCETYVEFQPKNANRQVVLFCEFQIKKDSEGKIPIIPDGCLELLFSCNPEEPFGIIATSPEHRNYYNFKTNCTYFGVRLAPEQSSLTLKSSIKDINKYNQVPITDVIDHTNTLISTLSVCNSFMERISVFNTFLSSKQTDQTNYDRNLIKYCINEIYKKYNQLNIKTLSIETGYSDRYLRKKFEEYIGVSPKQFIKIVRFQNYLNEVLNQTKNELALIEKFGYYDISHFYKEFKTMISIPPKQYIYGLNCL